MFQRAFDCGACVWFRSRSLIKRGDWTPIPKPYAVNRANIKSQTHPGIFRTRFCAARIKRVCSPEAMQCGTRLRAHNPAPQTPSVCRERERDNINLYLRNSASSNHPNLEPEIHSGLPEPCNATPGPVTNEKELPAAPVLPLPEACQSTDMSSL